MNSPSVRIRPARSARALSMCAALALGSALLAFGASAAEKDAVAAGAKASAAASNRITEEQAKEIALKALPGKVTGVTIEKKRGKNVYVVEIMSDRKGEVDVFVDLVTGKVIGTD